MRFDPGKAWPHPVLRPRMYGDDYPYAEFEVDIVVKIDANRVVEVDAKFELSDPDLLRIVDEGVARYALLVKASRTHFRDIFESAVPNIRKTLSGGDISGRAEFAPFLICVGQLSGFHADGWHQDFFGRTFDIATGSVLAEDVHKEYWIDTADEKPLGAIFGHMSRSDLSDGRWQCELTESRIWIVMSDADSERYTVARDSANNTADGQYLMNGIYLPALVQVLNLVDQNTDEYREFRWFASLDQRLEAVECKPLGAKAADRLLDAQRVLESPFIKMPIISESVTVDVK